MASSAFQISAFFLAFVGLLLLLFATQSSYWKTSSMATAVITANWIYEGLWMNCAANSLGSVQCKKFHSLLSLDMTGFLFTLGAWVIIGATLSNSYWKVSTVHGSVITTSSLYENLWHSCAEDSTGVSNCRTFDTLLALPGSEMLTITKQMKHYTKQRLQFYGTYIQACRALMIISLILGMCGTLLTLLGLRCTQLGNSSNRTKTKIAMTGGMVFILAGLSSMVAISWYAATITAQFFDSLYGGTKYELGYALYLGWAGSVLSILGGIFLTCSCSNKHSDYKYNYASEKVNEPRIYIKKSETVTPAQDYV